MLHRQAGAGSSLLVFGLGDVEVEQPLEVPPGHVLGLLGQVPFDHADGLHAPARFLQLRQADPLAQTLVQQECELPGRKQDGPPLRIVATPVTRIEHLIQLCRGPVEVSGMGSGDGTPVGDRRVQRRSLAHHQVEQAVGLGHFLGRRLRLQQQRAGPVQAQVEIHQCQRVRVAGQLVEIEGTVNIPVAVAGARVVRIELQGPAEGEQRLAVQTGAPIAQAAEGVLEDAKAGQDPYGVEAVESQGDEERKSAQSGMRGIAQQHPQREADGRANRPDFDLALLLVPGERQQVEERDAEQDLHGKEFQVGRLGEWILEIERDAELLQRLPERPQPGQGAAPQHDGEQQAEPQPREPFAHVAQDAEDDAQGHAAEGGAQPQAGVFRGVAQGEAAGDQTEDDARVNEGGTFEEKKDNKSRNPPIDLVPLPNLADGGNAEPQDQPGEHQQRDLADRLPAEAGRGGYLQGGKQERAQEQALEEIFRFQPAHGLGPVRAGIASGACLERNGLAKRREGGGRPPQQA